MTSQKDQGNCSNKGDSPAKSGKSTFEWKPVVTCFQDIEPCEVKWLWQDRIPLGRLSLISGRPGEGKSFLTTFMASCISQGVPWPDKCNCEKGSVLFVTSEDDPRDTIRPRLDAQNADPARVHHLAGIRRSNSDQQTNDLLFTLKNHEMLEDALKSNPDFHLVIIDPIGDYLGSGVDSHRDNEVRSVLSPIAKLAEKYEVAILLVAHTKKGQADFADDTVLGSRAFTGLSRAVWHLQSDPHDRQRRLLLPGKNNLAARSYGLAFRIEGSPGCLTWEDEPVDIDVDELVQAANKTKRLSKLEQAMTWLKDILNEGPMLSTELLTKSKEANISKATFTRAKTEIGVICKPPGAGKPWVCRLPP